MPATDFSIILTLLAFTDWSNDQLLAAAASLDDEQLDRDMQIGVGGMRRTMLHIYNGELVWGKRWRGGADAETKWPSETESVSLSQLTARFEANRRNRDQFLSQLAGSRHDLSRVQAYRDSKGSMFNASLADMVIQCIMHSKHHQAQAANILRRLGASAPDLDYMYHVRKPA
jgi:uncharacterized damage-inducible protein DinB